MRVIAFFTPDYVRYEGVRPFNIHLLRLLFLLMFVFVGYDSWAYIINHQGPWDPVKEAPSVDNDDPVRRTPAGEAMLHAGHPM